MGAWIHSLRFRLIAGSIVVLLLLFGLISVKTSRLLSDFAVENTRALIAQTSEMLNLALVPHTDPEGLTKLEDYLDGLVSKDAQGVVYLALLDEHGAALSHSRGVPDPLPDTGVGLNEQLHAGVVHISQPILYGDDKVGTLRYGLSTQLLRQANRRLIGENLALLATGLTVTIVILVWGGLRVGSRLGRLVQATRALAAGIHDIRAPEVGGSEFSDLGRSFNHMVDAVAQRTRDLQDSQAQLTAMLNNPDLLIGLADTDGRIERLNEVALALNDCGLDQLKGRPLWEMPIFAHESGVQRRISEAVSAARQGEPRHFELNYTSGGEQRIGAFSLHPVRDAEGKVAWLVPQAVDVTERVRGRDRLDASERRLHSTLELSPNVAVQWFDDKGEVIYWSPASEKLFGFAADEALGKTLDRLFYTKEQAVEFMRLLQYVSVSRDRIGPEETDVVTQSGEQRFVESTIFSIPGDQPKSVIFVSMSIDVTERRRAADELERERRFLNTLIQTIPDLIWLKDPDGVYLACNARFEQFFGARQDQIIGKTDYDFVDKDLADFFRAHDIKAAEAGGPSTNEELITFSSDGHQELVETTKTPMLDAQDTLIGVLGVAHDITDRKRMEDELRQSDQRFRTLFESSPDPAWIIEGHRFVECNGAAANLLGYERKSDILDVHPSDVSPAYQPDGEVSFAKAERMMAKAQNQGAHRFDWVHLRADGSEFWAEVTLSPIMLDDRPVIYCTWRDITDRKQAESELQSYRENLEELVAKRSGELKASQQQLVTIIENLPAVFFTKDGEGRYQMVNRSFEQAVGVTREQAVGRTDRELMPSEAADDIMALDRRVLAGTEPVTFEESVPHPDGTQHSYLTTKVPLHDDDGNAYILIGIATDTTSFKHLQDELAQAQSIAHVGSWRLDVRDNTLQWSEETCRIFGVPKGTVINIEDFVDHIHPDDRERVMQAWGEALKGQPYDIEHRILARGQTKWVREQAHVGFDDQGAALVAVGAVQDISDIKQAEQLSLRALAEAQHAARAKSEFLANMSHEIRTPLNAMLGTARIGVRDADAEKPKTQWQQVLHAGEHLLGVINDILDYSKIEAGKFRVEPEPFELAAVVSGVADAMSASARQRGLEFVTDQAQDLPVWVDGDAKRLQQVLLNLLSNAIKFTEHGRVSLRLERSGECIRFAVSDTGIGMDQDQLSRLFRPFEQADSSTTRQYGGTGLGLAISHDLVKMMGGRFDVHSEPGHGSTFTFELPLPEIQAQAVRHAPAVTGNERRLAGVRVLVAEDVEINREILDDLLAFEGAGLTFAEHGARAVGLVREHGASAFDVVLMDIQMPVMDGFEATRRIRAMAPSLPVIGLTAHAFEETRRECLAAGMVEHVSKPIDIDRLVQVIAEHVAVDASDEPVPASPTEAAVGRPDTNDADGGPIDWTALSERFGGRQAFIDKLVAAAVAGTADSPAKLREAVERGDHDGIAFVAHATKGLAGNLMATSVHELARRTEIAARGHRAETMALASDLVSAIDGLNRALRRRGATS